MTRSRLVILLALVVAVPAAAGGSFFASSFALSPQPCFMADTAAYRLTGSASANYTIRVDNDAARPDLRLQLVDDPSLADFVLVDDGDAADTCRETNTIRSIRVDAAAAKNDIKPDMMVTLSKQAAEGDYKIYVRSANFTEQDAAALFAVIWKNAHTAGVGREFLARR
jgi:hypothetical protein